MPASNEERLVHDLVFTPRDSDDFQNVHVELEVKEDGLLLSLMTDEPIGPYDVQKILHILQEDEFKRMRLRLTEECMIFLYVGNRKYQVIAEGKNAEIKDLIPLER